MLARGVDACARGPGLLDAHINLLCEKMLILS
jgi:hypothetical protein